MSSTPAFLATTLCILPLAWTAVARADAPALTVAAARVSIEGTSNVHAYTASTSAVRVTRIEAGAGIAAGAPTLLDDMLKPGGIQAFDVAVSAATLTSPRDGLDKNMHKALKVTEFPDITFHLVTLEPSGTSYRAAGTMTLAGVTKDVVFTLKAQRAADTIVVNGTANLLMTDFGIQPPKAMMGMLKTDPKVLVRVELTLAAR